MPNQEFNFSTDGAAPSGWRLDRLEMANWGTFGEGQVHRLLTEGGWSLLVGENGSGKSTAVDALRTLLAPRAALHHSFNDAAGGQKRRDRTLVTYIRGAWATLRDEDDAPAETKFLRKEGEPTYLLAVFRNARRQAVLTLAQILWVMGGKDETVYLVGGGAFGIAENLQGLETGRGMKKALAGRGFDLRDSYKAYREDFCERMGIPGEGALEIFNQAIGVKEVTDVSHFLRRNLLAPGGAPEFIQTQVIPRFSDLESCWNDIERAERQIELLGPVAQAYAEATELEVRRAEVNNLIQARPFYYRYRHVELLRAHLDRCELEKTSAEAELAELETRQRQAQEERDQLRAQFDADETSRRIEKIELDMEAVRQRAATRQTNYHQLAALLRDEQLGSVPASQEAFVTMRSQLAGRLDELTRWQDDANTRANGRGAQAAKLTAEIKATKDELDLLQGRPVLIPGYLQRVRDALCQATGVAEEALPFAGELIEVKPECVEDWGGAIERLLHNFGVSLLVPERHYQQVARWINGRRLTDAAGDGVRLAFQRVSQDDRRPVSAPGARSVAGRLNFREEHPLARWTAGEVQGSFPHVCCHNTEELERERYGLTADGLIRNGTRHVKDDRRALNSRSQYVLGWSPERKIQALRQQLTGAARALDTAQNEEKAARREANTFQQRAQKIEAANGLEGFAAIDFSVEQARLAELAIQRAELEKSSQKRETLQRQLETAETRLVELRNDRDKIVGNVREQARQIEQFNPQWERLDQDLARETRPDLAALAPAYTEAENGVPLTHLNLGEVSERVNGSLRGRASNLTAKINEAEKRMIGPMEKFLAQYPSEAKTLRAQSEYAPEFVAFHDQLVREDLLRHKERFRDFLNTNLNESIGSLEATLDAEVKTHRARITQVNGALRDLEYGDGTFVEIVRRDTRDAGIRDFRAKMRDCLAAGLTPLDETQRLELYKKIREIVTRFVAEPEWMARVADSRLWLEFYTDEHRRADGVVINSMGSSTGKSGGQKAKMAFTILAASLLAQYGLADDPARADSLRLVVVDEVFARTDASNSHRALELFQRLGFQLLLAAPWKAEARIAERYVDNYHLTVNNADGNASRVRRATRAQYEAIRQETVAAHG